MVFLDASYIIALEEANDQNHRIALRHWRRVARVREHVVTTPFVFDAEVGHSDRPHV